MSHVDNLAPRKPRVLLIDDQEGLLARLKPGFEAQGLEIVSAHFRVDPTRDANLLNFDNVGDLGRYVSNPANRIDAVLTDCFHDDLRYGLDVVELLKARHFNGPVFAHSSVKVDAEISDEAKQAVTEMTQALQERGADGFLAKPMAPNGPQYTLTADAIKAAIAASRGKGGVA